MASHRNFNLGNILVVIGLLGLLTTFFIPVWSSSRIARIEGRAEQTSRLLMEVAVQVGGDPAAQRDRVLELLRERCADAGQPASDLPALEPEERSEAVFGNRHYLFRAAPRPSPTGDDESTPRPIEVYGWPRTVLPPGRSVFVFRADGDPAFSRNLSAGYEGLRRRPPPGTALPVGSTTPTWEGPSYRSANEERWIRLVTDRT